MTQTYTSLNASVVEKLLSGEQIMLDHADTLEVESNVLPPSTGKPWVEITYQWLKDNLTAYIDLPSAADNASKNIAAEAVYD